MKSKFVFVAIFTLILFSTAMTRSASPQVITDGLVSYWPFDEIDIQARIVKDVWGNNHGTFDAAPELVPGKVGNAFKFSGNARPNEILQNVQ